MTVIDIIILIYGIGVSWTAIRLIEHGLPTKLQVYGCLAATLVAVAGALWPPSISFNKYLALGFLTLPIVSVGLLNLAGFVSWKISGRELHLTWREARFYYTASRNWLDYLLTMLIVSLQLFWPFLSMFLFAAVARLMAR